MLKVRIKGNLLAEFRENVKDLKRKELAKVVVSLKEATPIDTGEARDGWYIEGSTIKNDVEHIEFLNNGSSEQAPVHFIEKTLLAQKGLKPSGTIVR